MNVTLNIENDSELRAFIKDAIKGQILSIVREEFVQIVKDELDRKIKGSDKYQFERMQSNATRDVISEILYKEHSIGKWNQDFLRPIVEPMVNNAIKDTNWKELVDKLVKEKVRALIG